MIELDIFNSEYTITFFAEILSDGYDFKESDIIVGFYCYLIDDYLDIQFEDISKSYQKKIYREIEEYLENKWGELWEDLKYGEYEYD